MHSSWVVLIPAGHRAKTLVYTCIHWGALTLEPPLFFVCLALVSSATSWRLLVNQFCVKYSVCLWIPASKQTCCVTGQHDIQKFYKSLILKSPLRREGVKTCYVFFVVIKKKGIFFPFFLRILILHVDVTGDKNIMFLWTQRFSRRVESSHAYAKKSLLVICLVLFGFQVSNHIHSL